MKLLRKAGDGTVKTTVEQNSDARVGYRISVCSSGAASICQRASMKVIGHTIHTRVPHRGPASGAAQSQMSMQTDLALRDECDFVRPYAAAERGSTS